MKHGRARAFFFLLILPLLALAAQAANVIRVALIVQSPWMNVACPEGLVVESPEGRILYQGASADFSATGSGVALDGRNASSGSVMVRSSAPFILQGKAYRGELEIRNVGGSLDAVNILPVEKYLYSVVGSEMPSKWPMEALKAQAVVARTYALKKIEERRAFPYDVVPTTADQAYDGVENETDATRAAVNETRGEVVTYEGKLIMAYYHSDCGGETENGSAVFKGNFPYLKSKSCPYDEAAPYRHWSKTYTLSELSQLFGVKVLELSTRTDPVSRRVERVTLDTPRGPYSMAGSIFRRLLGVREIRSTYFNLSPIERVVYVSKMEKVPLETVVAYASSRVARWVNHRLVKPLGNQLFLIDGTGALTSTQVSGQNPFVILSGDGSLSVASGGLSAAYIKSNLAFERVRFPLRFKKTIGKEMSWVPVRIPAAYTFSGKGWGHGVGLCQWGARGMALLGKTYKEILRYYYTGVKIQEESFSPLTNGL